ncbi:MAG TPA: NTP transferase domain-containing protein [Acidimicrobiales bacterium]|nr:NTP transferase domain-containing protein [Acidimicrobiales bacterium]
MTSPSLVILAAGRARRYGGVKQLAPVGMHGEGVIDLIASDAFAAGFGDVVIVINPDTGPEIQEHVAEFWPEDRKVTFTHQTELRGTVSAVLAAESVLDVSQPFAVSNADDLYGRESFRQLGEHLTSSTNNCLVGFELERALVGELPVSRGTCMVVNGHLTEIVERRNVQATLEGFIADDGLEPRNLHPSTIVSMNLWGFQPSIFPLMHKAMEEYDFDKEKEVQLSTFVGGILHRTPLRFDVMRTTSRCIGVTHAEDLPLAQVLVRQEIEVGDRPEFAFAS